MLVAMKLMMTLCGCAALEHVLDTQNAARTARRNADFIRIAEPFVNGYGENFCLNIGRYASALRWIECVGSAVLCCTMQYSAALHEPSRCMGAIC